MSDQLDKRRFNADEILSIIEQYEKAENCRCLVARQHLRRMQDELARLHAVDEAWKAVRAKHCDPDCNWMDIMLETDRQITLLDSLYPIPPQEKIPE